MNENLNIEYHKKRLLLKALNVCKKKEDACKALGISNRTLYRLIKLYKIKLDPVGVYFFSPNKKILINY